jgi:hypothetical protein
METNITEQYIISNSTEVVGRQHRPCIYFLINNDTIVYVGQSVHPNIRIATHVTQNLKEFNRYFILDVPCDTMNDIEAECIWKLAPIYNTTMPPNNNYKSWGGIKRMYKEYKRYGFDKRRLNKIVRENDIQQRHHWYDFRPLQPLIEAWVEMAEIDDWIAAELSYQGSVKR